MKKALITGVTGQDGRKRLTLASVVLSTRRGNLRVFQANPASPLYPELVSLTRKTCGVATVLMQAMEPLRPKLSRALIYGSMARQEDTSASDVDVMLVGGGPQFGRGAGAPPVRRRGTGPQGQPHVLHPAGV
jgi:hypothetical protein